MARSVTSATTARLREMIVRGAFTPGEHLVEATLAEQLGTSRTPVRAALAAAHHAGLLDYGVNRGYVVLPFDSEDFVDAYEARGLIEGAICRTVAENGLSGEAERRMREASEKVGRILDTHESVDGLVRERWHDLNAQFHDALVDECRNRTFVTMLRNLQETRLVAPVVASYDRALLMTYKEQHEQILASILRRQGSRAEHLMREHVLLAAEKTVAGLAGSSTTAARVGHGGARRDG